MAERLIQEETLQNIGNAIREMTGGNAGLDPVDMPDAIRGIETGVDTSDADATAAHILSGKTAYVNGEKVVGSIPSQAAQTIIPATFDKTIANGKYLSGDQTIKGDPNLIATNILSGKSIFGVEGSFSGNIYHRSSNIEDMNGSYLVEGFDFQPKYLYIYQDVEATATSDYRYTILSLFVLSTGDCCSTRISTSNRECINTINHDVLESTFEHGHIELLFYNANYALNGNYQIFVFG